jgi:membrane protease subunit HflC
MNSHPIRLAVLTAVLLVALFLLLPALTYVVDQRETAVVLQFGNPVEQRTEPGLYFKMPFVQTVQKLPATRQFWGNDPNQSLPDLPTKDDKKIELIPWAIWRVTDPTVFVRRLQTMEKGELLVAELVRAAIRDRITKHDLAELVRSSGRLSDAAAEPDAEQGRAEVAAIRFGRHKILAEIKQEAQRRLAAGAGGDEASRGIELIDVGISQIEFVESVRRKTFDRWVAERQAVSARNVNEGERLKQELLNRTQAEVQKIEGEGQKRAYEIRGEVDAEVIRKYAKAVEQAGEFYTFLRTLEAYKLALGKDTRMILTTDSDFLRLLKGLPESPSRPAAANGSATPPTSPR